MMQSQAAPPLLQSLKGLAATLAPQLADVATQCASSVLQPWTQHLRTILPGLYAAQAGHRPKQKAVADMHDDGATPGTVPQAVRAAKTSAQDASAPVCLALTAALGNAARASCDASKPFAAPQAPAPEMSENPVGGARSYQLPASTSAKACVHVASPSSPPPSATAADARAPNVLLQAAKTAEQDTCSTLQPVLPAQLQAFVAQAGMTVEAMQQQECRWTVWPVSWGAEECELLDVLQADEAAVLAGGAQPPFSAA
jgi:hypothetical protein